ncbi:GNAT family N-acetyltransferase [Mitsuaria sp. GD03876]|uniref:GNAT family N-acetyltransferase n=1 Tax=Mitsuaria sp. GD03876 TaxID=2975399 RepID=UPI00244C5903|nr:GNAT family N-acetyltransferase [Mitsuaria sp. GD03876]MDH0865367.1 GNAT family N-acetyltransferase [Mitsuaria sp. GD03876]
MRWRNQLEPQALLDRFAAAPPEGFRIVDTLAAPAFEAPFDLLTTADDALRATARRLPLFRWWSRALTVRTLFVGTTVSEYAPLPADADVDGLAAAVADTAVRRRFTLAILKDLPQDSPLLLDEDNRHARALAQACERRGYVLVEGQALAYVAVDFHDIDTYLARLSSSRRKNIRRKLRSRAELTIRRIPTGAHFDHPAIVDAYFALYEGVYAQSEIHFDKLTRPFFEGVLRDRASGGVVFEYRRAYDDALVGWNLCYEQGGRLVDKYIGLSYPAARDLNLYVVSWVVNLEYAIERRLTHYVAGWTDPEVKASLGARFTFTRHAVFVRNPLLRAVARRFSRHFESDRIKTS